MNDSLAVFDSVKVTACDAAAGVGFDNLWVTYSPIISGGEQCTNNPDGCLKPTGGIYQVGEDLCLSVPCPVSPLSMYAWSKDGMALENGGRVFGVGERTLEIFNLQVADSGLYTCAYDDWSKGMQVFEAHVTVAEQLPLHRGWVVPIVLATIIFSGIIAFALRRNYV